MILALLAISAMYMSQRVYGSAPIGLASSFATSSTVVVGPFKPNTASTTMSVFDASVCTSRVITTYAQPVTVMWSNSVFSSTTPNPSAGIGHLQLASTTVAYDSGIFGCGYVAIYGLSSTTITISEFR